LLGPIFVFPIVAVLADLGDTRRYLEPLELLPMLVMFLAQCGVIACKYGVLPASHTSDAHGKIYRPIKPADLTRTLILGAWNDPKNANHFDLLKMEIENACLEADVDLSHTEIHVGSAEAARAIRLRSRGIGERASGSDREDGDGDPGGGLAPEVVSGKELMAALVDVHVGRALPPSFMPGIMLLSLLYGLAGPAARARCGVPMFGATPASEFAAAGMFIFNVMMFLGNFMFAATCAWHYRRLFCVMRALSRMARFPGEPLENFFPARIGGRGVGSIQGGVFVVSVVSRASEGGRGRFSREVRKTAGRVDRREGPRELPRVVSGASRDEAGGFLVGAADEPLLRHLPRLRVLLRGHAPRPVLRREHSDAPPGDGGVFLLPRDRHLGAGEPHRLRGRRDQRAGPRDALVAQARERGHRRAARLPRRGGQATRTRTRTRRFGSERSRSFGPRTR
jgi:hypothetical protein